MIDRMGIFTERLATSEPTGGTAERPGRGDRHVRARSFEDLVDGAARQPDETSATRTPVRPALVSRIFHRSQPGGHAVSVSRNEVAAEPSTSVEAPPELPSAAETDAAATAGATEAPRPSAAAGSGFVRSNSVVAPHLVRYAQVPASAQYPDGPYVQAPSEAGGEWWYVNPFTGSEPWRNLEGPVQPPGSGANSAPLPVGFEQTFGTRPARQDFTSHSLYRTAVVQWEQDLSHFQQSGIPEGFDQSQVDAATSQFEAWGMGKPVFYEGRYGWQVRFPDSQLPSFDTTASTALTVPHIVIAEYQVRAIQEGISTAGNHPFLPEYLRPA